MIPRYGGVRAFAGRYRSFALSAESVLVESTRRSQVRSTNCHQRILNMEAANVFCMWGGESAPCLWQLRIFLRNL